MTIRGLVKTLVSSPLYGAALTGIVSFVVYATTLSPAVGIIDSGELAAVACTLGVAHPTGYPLFTLLGWVFSVLPIAAEKIVRLNLMSAIMTALSISVFFLLVSSFVRMLGTRLAESGGEKGGDLRLPFFASVGASFVLAFSETVWTQALAVEVYPVHLLLVSITLTLFLAVLRDADAHGQAVDLRWRLVAFVLGLSFANHMTTVLLLPGMIVLYFSMYRTGRKSLNRLVRLVPFFLLGLSIYLYLPVRASQAPLYSWGDVTSVERFIWHVTAKQYRVWMFSSLEVAGRQFLYFGKSLPSEFGYGGALFALLGIPVLWKAERKLFTFTVLLFLTCVVYSVNYDIHDIDSYFLLAYSVMALWAGCGIYRLLCWLRRVVRLPQVALLVVSLVAPLVSCLHHYSDVDQSGDFMVEDYTMNMFESFEPNAVVLSYQWDYWVSASYYYQAVQGVRPDLVIIDKELLRRSWYFKELERRFPWLIAASEGEVNAFRKQLYRFEHGLRYDARLIQGHFEKMIMSFITKSISDRPVYVTREIEPEFTRGFQRVPQGLAFRLYADSLFHPTPFPRVSYRPIMGQTKYVEGVRSLYARALAARGDYYLRWGEAGEASRAYEAASVHDPSFSRK